MRCLFFVTAQFIKEWIFYLHRSLRSWNCFVFSPWMDSMEMLNDTSTLHTHTHHGMAWPRRCFFHICMYNKTNLSLDSKGPLISNLKKCSIMQGNNNHKRVHFLLFFKVWIFGWKYSQTYRLDCSHKFLLIESR